MGVVGDATSKCTVQNQQYTKHNRSGPELPLSSAAIPYLPYHSHPIQAHWPRNIMDVQILSFSMIIMTTTITVNNDPINTLRCKCIFSTLPSPAPRWIGLKCEAELSLLSIRTQMCSVPIDGGHKFTSSSKHQLVIKSTFV